VTAGSLRLTPAVRPWARAFERHGYATVAYALLIVLTMVSWGLEGDFFTNESLSQTLAGAAPVTIATLAVTIPILSGNGGIDLSVGPLISLINVTLVSLTYGGQLPGDWWAVVPVALGIGCASGLLNGVLVSVLRIQPIVATLATFLLYGALADMVVPDPAATAPDWLGRFAEPIGPIPGPLFPILLVLGLWLLIVRTPFNRYLYATGDNEAASFSAGVPVVTVRLLAYVICGLFTAVAALSMTALIGSADANVGNPITLTAIAGAALGGTALAGGRGGLLGALAGGLSIYLVENVLTVTHVPEFYVTFSYGAILVASIVANGLLVIALRRRRA
jgi:ribose transport system permease protein